MAITLALAGAQVVIVGRSEGKAKSIIEQFKHEALKFPNTKELGQEHRIIFEPADVCSRTELEQACHNIYEKYHQVNILINGAGVNSATPFLNISDEEYSRIMDTNFAGVVKACQIFGAKMTEQENGGSIINIGSISGRAPLSRVFIYSASKAALHSLSINLAREWGPKKVRVNTLVPGFFPAEQNRAILDTTRVQSIMQHTPMGRFGESDELAGALLLLASPVAGAFITGTELVVDGGFESVSI